jgi:hypothetical protein
MVLAMCLGFLAFKPSDVAAQATTSNPAPTVYLSIPASASTLSPVATVTNADGSTPQGTVTLYLVTNPNSSSPTSTLIQTVGLTNGVATFSGYAPGTGSYTFVAVYSPFFGSYTTGSFTASGSTTVLLTATNPTGTSSEDDSILFDQIAFHNLQDTGFEFPALAQANPSYMYLSGSGSVGATYNSQTTAPTTASYLYNPPVASPWTFSSGNAGLAYNETSGFGNPTAPQGVQCCFLQVSGSVSQTANFSAGTYFFSCSAAYRSGYTSTSVTVAIDGTTVGTFTPTSTAYATYTTGNFAVTAGSHTVSITNVSGNIFIDNVQMNISSGSALTTPPVLVDQGFEYPSAASYDYANTFTSNPPPNSAWTFWNTASCGVDHNGGPFYSGSAPQGIQALFVQGQGSGGGQGSGVSQSCTFTAGTYTVNLCAAQRSGYVGGTIYVYIDSLPGGTVAAATQPTGTAIGSFVPASTSFANFATSSFTVAAGTHTITIWMMGPAGNASNGNLAVDLIQLTCSSSPSLLGPGFESPATTNYTYSSTFASNPPPGSGWTFWNTAASGVTIAADSFGAPAAAQGSQMAFLQGTGSSSNGAGSGMSQSCTFPAGTYTLSLSASERSGYVGGTIYVYIDSLPGGTAAAATQPTGTAIGTFVPSAASFATFTTSAFTVTAGTHSVTIWMVGPTGNAVNGNLFVDNVLFGTSSNSLIVNPSFEAPALASSWQVIPAGNGWTGGGVVSNTSGGYNTYNSPAPNGTQVGALQVSTSSALGATTQQAVVFPGGTYKLTLNAQQRFPGINSIMKGNGTDTINATPLTLTVSVGGTTMGTFTPPLQSWAWANATVGAVQATTTTLSTVTPSIYLPATPSFTVGVTSATSGYITGAVTVTATSPGLPTVTATQNITGPTSYTPFTTSSFTFTGAASHTIKFLTTDTNSNLITDNTIFIDNVIVNGTGAPSLLDPGFELPALGSGYQYAGSMSANPPTGSGWTFAPSVTTPTAPNPGAGVAYNGSGFTSGNPNAPQGVQVCFLQGAGASVSQTASFPAGTYTVSFMAAQRSGDAQTFQVLVDGIVVGNFTTCNSASSGVVSPTNKSVTFGNVSTSQPAGFTINGLNLSGSASGTPWTINASFSASGAWGSSATSTSQTVTVYSTGDFPTTTTISAPAITFPATATVTVTVTSNLGSTAPTGAVTLGIGGTSITANGTLANQTTTSPYQATFVYQYAPSPGTYAVTASYNGTAPGGQASTAASVNLVVNPAPAVTFGAASETVYQASGTFSVTVNLSATTSLPVSVPFTLSGTAVSGTDYSGVSASPLTIPAGSTSAAITGTLLSHTGASPTMIFTLGTPTNATLGTLSVNTMSISEPTAPTVSNPRPSVFLSIPASSSTLQPVATVTNADGSTPQGTVTLYLVTNPSSSPTSTLIQTVSLVNGVGTFAGYAPGSGSYTFIAVYSPFIGTYTTGSFTASGSSTIVLTGTNPTINNIEDDSVLIDQLAFHNLQDTGFEFPALAQANPSYLYLSGNVGTTYNSLSTAPTAASYLYNPPVASPWTYSSGSNAGIVYNETAGFGNPTAPQGVQACFLQVGGSVSQTANFSAGSYVFSCSAAYRSGYGASTFTVAMDGVTVGTLYPTSTSYGVYTTGTFAVSPGSHTLSITNLSGNVFIDNVQMTLGSGSTITTAPVLVDPGFESPSSGSYTYANSFTSNPPSGSAWTFWNTASCGVDYNGGPFFSGSAPQGNQALFVQGQGSGGGQGSGVSQSCTFTAGSYTLNLCAAQRSGYVGGTIYVYLDSLPGGTVAAATQPTGTLVGSFVPSSTSFVNFATSPFTVAAGTHTITLWMMGPSGNASNGNLCVDLVQLTCNSTPSLLDPGFESPATTNFTYSSSFSSNPPPGSGWTFWNTNSSGVNLPGDSFGAPAAFQGTQMLFLQGIGPGNNGAGSGVSQSCTFTAGTYTISLSASQRSAYPGGTIYVYVDSLPGGTTAAATQPTGTAIGTFVPPTTSFTELTTSPFTVTAGTHTVTLWMVGPSGNAINGNLFVDNVQIGTASVINNPSFESPALPLGWEAIPAGYGWTGGGVQSNTPRSGSNYNSNNPPAPNGTQYGVLQAGGNGGASPVGNTTQQTVNFPSGTYNLTLNAQQRFPGITQILAGNGTDTLNATGLTLTVSIGGTTYGTFTPPLQSWGWATGTVAPVQTTTTTLLPVTTPVTLPATSSFTVGVSSASSGYITGAVTLTATSPGLPTVTATQSLTGSQFYTPFTTSTFTFGSTASHTIQFLTTDTNNNLIKDNTIFIDNVIINGTGAPSLIDPGFELPALGSGYQYAGNMSANPPVGSGWTFAPATQGNVPAPPTPPNPGAGVAYNASGFTDNNTNAPQGVQVCFLQGVGASVSQSISFPAGTYSISFMAAQRTGDAQTFQVLIDGSVVGNFTTSNAASSGTVSATNKSVTFGNVSATQPPGFTINGLNLSGSPSGTPWTISASFAATGPWSNSATTSSQTVTVYSAANFPTTTTISAPTVTSPGTATVTVTVTASSGSAAPSGAVTLGIGGVGDITTNGTLGSQTSTSPYQATYVYQYNPSPGTYSVTASYNGVSLGGQASTATPVNLVVNPPPTVTFAAASETVLQSSGTFSITLNLSAATGLPVSVPFTLTGTAVSGTDYSGLTPSPLTIPAGSTSGTITGTMLLHYGSSQTMIFTLGSPTNAALGAITVNTLTITEPPPPPTISSVSPSNVDIGGGTIVTITGQHFTGLNTNALSSVTFAGVSAAKIESLTDTQIVAVTAPASAATGTVQVTVNSTTASWSTFTYGGGAVSSIATVPPTSPPTGPITGGTTVTITGAGFAGATAVSFGTIPAASFSVNANGTQITAVSPPAAAAGPVNINVTVSGVSSTFTTADQFTYELYFNYSWTTWSSLNWSTPTGSTITWNSQSIPVAVSVNNGFYSWYTPATQIGVNSANGALSGNAWSATPASTNIAGSNPGSGMNGPYAGIDPTGNNGSILTGDWKDLATAQLSYYGTYANATAWNNPVFWSYYNAAFPASPTYSVTATTTTVTNNAGSQYFIIADGIASSPLGRTSYVGNSGMYYFNNDTTNPGNSKYSNGPFFQDSKTALTDIPDGSSNTLLFGESLGGADNALPTYQLTWMGTGTMPSYWDCQTPSQYFMFSSMHPGIVNFAFCDGSVRSVTKVTASVPPDAMGTLATADPGDGTNVNNDTAKPPAASNPPTARWIAFQLLAGTNDNASPDFTLLGLTP